MVLQHVLIHVKKNINNGSSFVWLLIHCRKENSNRLSIFSKGSAILQDWIKQSNEELSQTAERKNKIADEIASLEKQIEVEEATLNEIRAKVATQESSTEVWIITPILS